MAKKIRVIGKLITEEGIDSLYSQGWNRSAIYTDPSGVKKLTLQIISELPSELDSIKYAVCIIDRIKGMPHIYKESDILDFISDKLIIFEPNINEDPYSCTAYNPELILFCSLDDTDKAFVGYPFLDLEPKKIKMDTLLEYIHNNNSIPVVAPTISYNEDDLQEFVVVKSDGYMYLLGNVKGITYISDNSISITEAPEGLKVYKIPLAEFTTNWIHHSKETVVFTTFENEQRYSRIFENIAPEASVVKEVPKPKEEEGVQSVAETSGLNNTLKAQLMNVGLLDENEKPTIKEEPAPKQVVFVKQEKTDVNSEKLPSFIESFEYNAKVFGLSYERTDLVNFHNALRSSKLVVLAGASGTGKSKLVNLYGKTMGLKDEMLMIPVSPAWTDDSDVLGYLDQHAMLYRPADTNLVDLLIKAQNNPEKLFLVCFDEMNLAKVEHYFAQFISVLENSSNNRIIKLYNRNLESRVYNSQQYPCELTVGDNVLFVGTVNVDESTAHFSDKVLDRAHVIELQPKSFDSLLDLVQFQDKEPVEHIFSGLEDYYGYNLNKKPFILTEQELNLLTAIEELFQSYNPRMHVGYRVASQMNNYLLALGDNVEFSKSMAIDDIILQRVLTKLRGTGEMLKNIIGEINQDGDITESNLIELFDRYSDLSDFSNCRKKVLIKAKELRLYGYTI